MGSVPCGAEQRWDPLYRRTEDYRLGITEGPPRKPNEGDACNGCGLCCALELCALAVEFLEAAAAPCPAMEFAEGRFWCGLVRHPNRYLGTPLASNRLIGPMVHEALCIGEGCDAAD